MCSIFCLKIVFGKRRVLFLCLRCVRMSTTATLDKINGQVETKLYPLSLPAKHLQNRIPSDLTMNKIILYYTLWNWIALFIALTTRNNFMMLYSQASSLIVACIITVAWFVLGFPFFKQFYGKILQTHTSWLIVWADAVLHFSPVLIIGLPKQIRLSVLTPCLTFWIWYIAMRPHLKNLYGGGSDSVQNFTYDKVAIGGTVLWAIVLCLLAITWHRPL